jgi:hypothetical protein
MSLNLAIGMKKNNSIDNLVVERKTEMGVIQGKLSSDFFLGSNFPIA